MLGGVAVLTVVLLGATVRGFMRAPAGVPLEPAFAADQFRPDDDPQWPGHWVDPPGPWEPAGGPIDTDAAVDRGAGAITDLPSPQHEVIVARDVEGRSPAEVRDELDLTRPRSATCSTRPGAACVPSWTTPLREAARPTTPGRITPPPDMACKDFVELITAYLDGALPDDVRARSTSTSTGATDARTCSPNGAPSSPSPAGSPRPTSTTPTRSPATG